MFDAHAAIIAVKHLCKHVLFDCKSQKQVLCLPSQLGGQQKLRSAGHVGDLHSVAPGERHAGPSAASDPACSATGLTERP